MRYAFYPGCTLEGTAREYEESTQRVFNRLGLELTEIPDWNCCGATAISAVSRLASLAIPLRNLALAEKLQADIAVACSACFMILSRAREAYLEGGELSEQLAGTLAAIGREYRGKYRVRHTLDIIANDVGPEDIARQVTVDLTGLRAVPYYGCQIARPRNDVFDTEFPVELDHLLTAVGLEVPRFDKKTKCCGAALMTTKPHAALGLNEEILCEATERKADFIVTTCPMCQMNLESFQDKINARFKTSYRVPVLYFSQVLGLALGIKADKLGLGRHIVSTAELTARARGVV